MLSGTELVDLPASVSFKEGFNVLHKIHIFFAVFVLHVLVEEPSIECVDPPKLQILVEFILQLLFQIPRHTKTIQQAAMFIYQGVQLSIQY